MKKLVKKVTTFLLVMVFLSSGFWGLVGCGNSNTVVRLDGWSFLRLGNRGQDGIMLVGIYDSSLISEDGVLYIPNKVGSYTVQLLGGQFADAPQPRGCARIFSGFAMWVDAADSPFDALDANKIVIPEGVATTELFWGSRGHANCFTVRFLATTPDQRNILFGVWSPFTIIVPDGAKNLYNNQLFQERADFPYGFKIIELSEFLSQE